MCEAASVTLAVKEKVPVTEGVPVNPPADVRDKPAGSEPDAMLHAYGKEPPAAARLFE